MAFACVEKTESYFIIYRGGISVSDANMPKKKISKSVLNSKMRDLKILVGNREV